ncbi:hypothetical protein QAD02_004387 [Eretmocerus hayati]|uniref:Uncharacterized protein n=1 Tax=Eretmocerus hayati TaxID=131215 RepID=A0ACC2NU85_9HYME|nr:hypothetical protein QAD02_004387 [Eretmocerus hayati]
MPQSLRQDHLLSCTQSPVKILQEIGLTSPANFILDHRERPLKENESYRMIVVKLVGEVRHMVLRNSVKLKDKTAQSIFGMGGNSRIFINQVYFHDLLLRGARKASKTLNYATPLVKNMMVFMRGTRSSDPILIKDELDIKSLKPRVTQSPDSAASMME